MKIARLDSTSRRSFPRQSPEFRKMNQFSQYESPDLVVALWDVHKVIDFRPYARHQLPKISLSRVPCTVCLAG